MTSRAVTSIFGDLRVRYDPWDVDYGDQTPLVGIDDEHDPKIDLDVEVDGARWEAIRPPPGAAPQRRVVFVDGVMRLESRITVRTGDRMAYGAFGSFAVGAAVLGAGAAAFGELRPFRAAVLGGGASLPGDVRVRAGLVYRAHTTPKHDLAAPLRYLQESMRREEARLAAELCREDTLVIVDGRLGFEAGSRGEALGYIKSIHDLYVPARYLAMIAGLPARTRTPLFAIQSAKAGFLRYAWFQRLEAPSPGATELHGVVRLEAANVSPERAARLADAATVWLPRLAPTRARDPRAPQNLLPIGALEQRLRTELGEPLLFRRWIETLIAKEASRDRA